MTDICKNCDHYGNAAACESVPCYTREHWWPRHAAGRIKALEKALVAEERFSRASGDIVGADNLLSILEKADE